MTVAAGVQGKGALYGKTRLAPQAETALAKRADEQLPASSPVVCQVCGLADEEPRRPGEELEDRSTRHQGKLQGRRADGRSRLLVCAENGCRDAYHMSCLQVRVSPA